MPYETIAEKLHKQRGYKVGVISSVNIDHATPAAFYAHQKSRKNYYDIGVELANSGSAGCGCGGYEEILAYTDLVLLDIKHFSLDGYHSITGQSPQEFLQFLSAVQNAGTPLWIRHVVVPGLTDSDAHLEGLRAYLHTIRNIQRVELLPYHTLGVNKYHALGIPYSLEDVPALLPETLADWQRRFDREFHI